MKDKIKWAKYLGKKGMFDGYDFVRLDVGQKSTIGEPENGAPVEYLEPNVFTLQPKNQLSKPPVATAERSKFIRRKDAWLFAEGVGYD